MLHNRRIACAIAVTAAVAGAAALPAAAAAHGFQHHEDFQAHGGAVFVQTDSTSGNAIVAYDRAANGTLTEAGTYPTGGLGGQLAGSVVDHFASQGSLTYDPEAHLLYALNAGSNTITVFQVWGDTLQRIQVISSGGTFPSSITTSGNLVYVANALNGGSIQGYVRLGDRLFLVPGWNRSLGLSTTATPQFLNSPGQIVFAPNGHQILVSTKANGNDIDVFRLGWDGSPSATPTVNAEGSSVPFALTFDQSGDLLVAAPGTNAVMSFSLAWNGTLTEIQSAATNQAATCWIVGTGRYFYTGNAGSASLTGFSDSGPGTLTNLGNTTTDPGTIDASISRDGQYLYSETGINGIVDEFAIGSDGSLTSIGSVAIPGGYGEGIAAR
jgi:6-phosphogluconolactonase (cycloisomerase 2 family)